MDIEVNKTETITWDIDGCDARAQVQQNGGVITITGGRVIMKTGSDNNLIFTDEQFVRDVHKALGELIAHVDRQRGTGRDLTREDLMAAKDSIQHTQVLNIGYSANHTATEDK